MAWKVERYRFGVTYGCGHTRRTSLPSGGGVMAQVKALRDKAQGQLCPSCAERNGQRAATRAHWTAVYD